MKLTFMKINRKKTKKEKEIIALFQNSTFYTNECIQ